MPCKVWAILPLLLVYGCARHSNGTASIGTSGSTAIEEQNDAVFASHRGGRDVTREFTQRFYAATSNQNGASSKAIEGCDILLVHGWLGETAIRLTHFLDGLNCNQRTLDYLKDQRYAAGEMGLCSMAPPFRSEAVCLCGEKIARLIASNPRQVIIVSHSKGCLDTLEALLRLQRDGQLNKVKGWISLQGPLYGSEEAATFLNHSNFVGKLRIKLLGARIEGLHDMTPIVREEYMACHRTEIDAVVHALPILCFASWKTPVCPNELLSDGHVEPERAILPGADYIAKSGVSHAIPVISRKAEYFDRITFTKTLLAMLSDRIEQSPE